MNTAEKTPLKVLFVEDSEIDAELALLELERDGFDVTWDRIELEADLRRKLATDPPQIVLSDYTMPSFNGLAALRVVHEVAADVPFIFMSGTIGEERAIESIRNGATDYVLKGNMRRLATAVRRALAETADRVSAKLAEEARARLAAILEATSDYVAICDPAGTLMYVNSATRELLGIDPARIFQTSIYAVHPGWARGVVEREGIPQAIANGVWQGETALSAADGTEVPVSQVIMAHRGPDGAIQYLSTIARDIRERKAYEEQIRYLANYDALTGLPNRSLLSDRLAQATTYGRRSDRTVGLLVIDIDRFKLVNDGYGQGAGDALLRLVADRLRGVVRDGDTVARFGADEFAVLAADLAHPDDIMAIVQKIQGSMRTPFMPDGREMRVSVSVGASVFPRDGSDFETLLSNANAALHRVKTEGRGGFQFYAAKMTREALERVELETDLRIALDRRELELHYQPQLLLRDGSVVGFEALMRWQHAERGWVSPLTFIAIAEHSDLIFDLGNLALSRACRQLVDWGERAAAMRVAVNVSARQFRSRGLPEVVDRVLRATGLEPWRLELELTESVLIDKPAEVVAILERLQRLGVRISVDDFGTGYSSLSYLSRLPIDCLKIDKSFIQTHSADHHNAAICQAIISLANSLGMRVIAEGIETAEQLRFLSEHGCQEGQGYLFSKPLPPDTVAGFIATLSSGSANLAKVLTR
jgi:diguanylate cyclase (GGDEF)-like protein/PAS domain S-box-containing protein